MRIPQNLNGVWGFAYYGNISPKPPFQTTEVMLVPGCFDLMEPYCGKRGYAVLTRKIHTGGTIELNIDGVGLSAEIFFDGHSVGNMKYAYMPEKFVFDAGTEKEHEIAIVLNNQYNDQFQPYFDFYGYGGVYGDVVLTRLARTHISELRIATEDYTTGKLFLEAEATGNFTGKASVSFDTGYTVPAEFISGKLKLEVILPNFRRWSPDSPKLHTATVSIGSDELTETFGIREFRAEGRKLFLNGKAVKLIGVNRHESHPTIGAAMPPQLMAYDLHMLKNAGFNFIRGSHYPQRKTFLELCDRMGFFVWEETLGWDVKAPVLHSADFLKAQLDEAEKLTLRSFNHPSIVIRGFLNENESDKQETKDVIKAVRDKIRSIDRNCLISYASNRYERDVCTDFPDVIAMNPYPGWYDSSYDNISGIGNIKRVLHELSESMPKDKPFLITEIGAEAIYGFRDPLKARWTEEYQAALLEQCCDYALSEEECAGIAIWQFADTRSYVTGPDIYARSRGFNNKGILDEFRRPKFAWDAISRLIKTAIPVDHETTEQKINH